MKTKLSCALIVAALASAATAQQIPAGTHLLLRMEHSISSKTAKPGDGVHMRTVTPINVAGNIVVPIGSYAQGTVVKAQAARLAHRGADLQIRLETLFLPTGGVVTVSALSSSFYDEQHRPSGPGKTPAVVLAAILAGVAAGGETGARIGLGAGAGAILIPIIAGRGKEIELRQGSALDVTFDQPAELHN
jgi:hypothetical protein